MNERIRKLIRTKSAILFPGTDTVDCQIDDIEKFAELIIEECAFQCQHLGDMERIGKHFKVDVFKQFGV